MPETITYGSELAAGMQNRRLFVKYGLVKLQTYHVDQLVGYIIETNDSVIRVPNDAEVIR